MGHCTPIYILCVLSRFSHVQLFAIPWAVNPPDSSVHGILQVKILEWVAMLSSRRFPNPGIEPASPVSPCIAGGFFTHCTTWEAIYSVHVLNSVLLTYICNTRQQALHNLSTLAIVMLISSVHTPFPRVLSGVMMHTCTRQTGLASPARNRRTGTGEASELGPQGLGKGRMTWQRFSTPAHPLLQSGQLSRHTHKWPQEDSLAPDCRASQRPG